MNESIDNNTDAPTKIWIPSKENAWEVAEVISVNESKDEVTVQRLKFIRPIDMNSTPSTSTTVSPFIEINNGAGESQSNTSSSNSQPTIKIGEPLTFKRCETHRADATHFQNSDDLCMMNHLHEAPLLDTLRRRFEAGSIYTTIGNVLVSVNPYKTIPGLYDNKLSFLDVPTAEEDEDGEEKKEGNVRMEGELIRELEQSASKPHVFKSANLALASLIADSAAATSILSSTSNATSTSAFNSITKKQKKTNQSIIVSGESGAGKTEASKLVMSFLIDADRELTLNYSTSDDENTNTDSAAAAAALGEAIKKVLLESNIIFESFGNSKTVRNDNSSRFGKYIKLQYTQDNRLVSAFTETFLLEKSRLVSVGAGERNYHIFYQLLQTQQTENMEKTEKLKKELLLSGKSGDSFKMLLDGPSGKALKAADDANFEELCYALKTVGCSEEELAAVWSILGAILHMSNITCEDNNNNNNSTNNSTNNTATAECSSTGGSGSDIGGGTNPSSTHVIISSPSMPLAHLSALLGVSEPLLYNKLVTQQVKIGTRSSITMKQLNKVDTANNISALCKWMYSRLFDWLVRKINFAHGSVSSSTMHTPTTTPTNSSSSTSSASTSIEVSKFIGILDIFGFEILTTNSFEQLCINYTNERLQQQFNEYVFDREQELYRSEGLDWAAVTYKDNQSVIDLIGGKDKKSSPGLLLLLETQGALNRHTSAEDAALLTLFNNTHAPTAGTTAAGTAYCRSRFTNDGKFTVKHFAGDVNYQIEGFLDKNNDSLFSDLLELMFVSTNEFIQNAIVYEDKQRHLGSSSSSSSSAGGAADDDEGINTKGLGYVAPIRVGASSLEDSMEKMELSSDSAAAAAAACGTEAASTTSSTSNAKASTTNKKYGTTSNTAVVGGGGGVKTTTVSYAFRAQLDSLLNTLRATRPHYIKCIKPNGNKVPVEFDSHMVLQQLRYSGALEVVRIRQEGYPMSMPFHTFYKTFEKLAMFKSDWEPPSRCDSANNSTTPGALLVKDYCNTLLEEVFSSTFNANLSNSVKGGGGVGNSEAMPPYQLGTSKVFLRAEAYEEMHLAVSAFITRRVVRLQALVRKRQRVLAFQRTVERIKAMQSAVRMFTKKSRYVKVLLAEKRRKREEEERAAAALEAARLKEEKERAERERREKQEAQEALKALEEAARLKAESEKEAELARIQAELDAEAARVEAEKQRVLAEEKEAKRLQLEAEKKAKRDAEEIWYRRRRLHDAAEKGDLESMKETLEEFPDDYLSLHFIDEDEDEDGSAAEKARLNGVPHINYTVLHSAVKSGNLAAVQYLNPTAEDVTLTNEAGECAMHFAVAAPFFASDEVDLVYDAALEPIKSVDALVSGGGPRVRLLRYLSQVMEQPAPTEEEIRLAQAELNMLQLQGKATSPTSAGSAAGAAAGSAGASAALVNSSKPSRKFRRLSVAPIPTAITTSKAGERRKSLCVAKNGTAADHVNSNPQKAPKKPLKEYKAPAVGLLNAANAAERLLEETAAASFGATIDKTTVEGAAMYLAAAQKASTTTVLKKGWMNKRGEGSAWRKRYIVLTNHSLLYYRNEKDTTPRDFLSFQQKNSLSIARNETHPTALDIKILNSGQSGMKNRSRVSLMADSEKELQQWLNMIKAVAGVENKPLRDDSTGTGSGNSTRTGQLVTVNPALRLAYFNQKNNNEETPLHIMASTHTVHDNDGNLALVYTYQMVIQAMSAVAWLVGTGCSVHEKDKNKHTALFRAVLSNNDYLAQLLAIKGSNPAMVLKVFPQLVASTAHKQLLQQRLNGMYQRYVTSSGLAVFKEPPLRLRGFSYLSLVLLSQRINIKDLFIKPLSMRRVSNGVESASGLDEYFAPASEAFFLAVTVYNKFDLEVESTQCTTAPVLLHNLTSSAAAVAGGSSAAAGGENDDHQVWLWLDTFHMQVPIDNVEDGSYLIVQLLKQTMSTTSSSSGGGRRTVGATLTKDQVLMNVPVLQLRLNIDKSVINTEVLTLPFQSIDTATGVVAPMSTAVTTAMSNYYQNQDQYQYRRDDVGGDLLEDREEEKLSCCVADAAAEAGAPSTIELEVIISQRRGGGAVM